MECESAIPTGIGPPDVVKAPCPVRGALGGNPLSKGSKDAIRRLHEFITALFYEIDEQLCAIPKHPAATSGPAKWSPWGCSMSCKMWGTGLLSLVDARLSAVVSAASRAHPALSSPQDPLGLDAGFLGRPDRTRGHRHLWHRVDPSDARRP